MFDFATNFASTLRERDRRAAAPVTVLAGIHVGCFELFGNEGIRSIADLKGKSVGVQALGSRPRVSVHAAWLPMSGSTPSRISTGSPTRRSSRSSCFVDGKIDAFPRLSAGAAGICAPGISAMSSSTPRWTARGRNISAVCSPAIADYVRNHPVATKRVLRADPQGYGSLRHRAGARRATPRRWRLHRALRLCAADAERNPYDKWREYDAEDTIRFYALRLHEVGLIKSTPQKIIADGTDWRFLDELKRELKA